MSETIPRRYFVQIHLLVVLLAGTAVLGHLISLPATALVVWRTLLAMAGAVFWLTVVRRKSLRLPFRRAIVLLGVGGIVDLHWLCFFGALKLANISICLAGLASISLFTALTEPLLEKRPVRRLEIALGLVAAVGILVIAGFERGHLAGLGLALLGALLAAIFPVINRRLVNEAALDPMLMVAWEMAGAFLVCLLGLAVFGGVEGLAGLFHFKGLDFLWLLLLGWVCTVFAHGFQIHLLRHLSAYSVNLALNFEPVYGIAAAAILFGEHKQLHPGFFVGTAAIVLANAAHALLPRFRKVAR